MSDEYADPSGNTEAFRAFAHTPETAPRQPSKLPLLIGVAVAAVLVVAVLAWFVLS
ncbi:hypothetical protein [Micromonospora zhanjiangensis]|uniref:Uncharacterized protein n=1 Tax=Micromonospora zhanjiangensis TaxID=1522057 RepID=A0ABV8KLH5_9ACTN